MGKLKKVLLIIAIIIIILIISVFLFYKFSLTKVSNDSTKITFIIEPGKGKRQIIEDLDTAGLIKNKYAAFIYMYLHKDYNMQAGTYKLSKNMSTEKIIENLKDGKVYNDNIKITFVEGSTLKKYISLIAKAYNWNEEELLEKINNKEYLNTLISKYWFLDESILKDGIYYPLEGYLMPSTYEFYKDATFEGVIEKILNNTETVLNKYKDEINNNQYSLHDLITIASIAEKEAIHIEDRYKVTQVIYKRLSINMSLGMDVTTYYGVQKDMKESLTKNDLINQNPYNTRITSFVGLPIGAICNPSENSIKAALNPADTDYIYFFADIKTGEVHFTSDYNEFQTFKELYS